MNWQNGFSLNKAMIVIAAIPIDDTEMPLCARRTRQGNRTTLTSSSSVAHQITPIPQQKAESMMVLASQVTVSRKTIQKREVVRFRINPLGSLAIALLSRSLFIKHNLHIRHK